MGKTKKKDEAPKSTEKTVTYVKEAWEKVNPAVLKRNK